MRPGIYTTVFCSLLVVFTWADERAWVLRTETFSVSRVQGTRKSVSLETFYGTRLACEEARIRRMYRQVQDRREAGVKDDRDSECLFDCKGRYIAIHMPHDQVVEVFDEARDGGIIIHQYSCLPDTVDPRGPKGK